MNRSTRLEALKNSSAVRKRKKLVGRGPSSGRGKTCGRGNKGSGARSGYKVRLGSEGGGVPLHRKVPTRGFSHAKFRKSLDVINLGLIERLYSDGEIVSMETLREKGFIRGRSHGIKILGYGELKKKVTFEGVAMSSGAKKKLGISDVVV